MGDGSRRTPADDPLAVDLEDRELLDEVDLTAALIAAANQADRPLSIEEIDRLLGVR